ncbi:PAS domain-containing protein [Methanosphaerula palustris]|uniref:histidine kinase n=1 Tax=Methanosphaerula palustris (strain ATCC BAA-1556 / DSM 19958 / E1-9c) TaxID=521011 RepID=B8GK99_METPE|nr:PAS domain S-box protein [Methanosphaerula palustris]ACL15782.1 putative PAS/PAC sensor protein [Methanosphaerula palustris E1-9c]
MKRESSPGNEEETDAYRACINEWERTFDAIVDPIYILNTSGEILRVNRAAADLVGMEPEAIIGQHCYHVVHRTEHFTSGCPFVRMKTSLRRESYQVQIQDRWFIATVDPVMDDQNRLLGAVHILTDITELKIGHEAEARLAAIVTSTENAIVGSTPDGTITSWNTGARMLTGYTGEEMVGSSLQRLVRPEDQEGVNTILAAITRGDRLHPTEQMILRKDGSTMEVSLSVSPIFDQAGAITGVSWICRDISGQRRAERALVAYLTEAALRLRNPVAIIRDQLAQVITLVDEGEMTAEHALMLLRVQVSNATQILANIDDLNRMIADEADDIPDAYRRFLMRGT